MTEISNHYSYCKYCKRKMEGLTEKNVCQRCIRFFHQMDLINQIKDKLNINLTEGKNILINTEGNTESLFLDHVFLSKELIHIINNEFTFLEKMELNNCSFATLLSLNLNLEYLKVLTINYAIGFNDLSFFISTTRLEKIKLINNALTTIPNFIKANTGLKILEMDDNLLNEVPKEIFNLKDVEKLSFSNNNIEKISNNIKNLSNLKELYLANNKLNSLPKSLLQLSNLKILSLTYNDISFQDEIVKKLRLRGVKVY